jgi:hypothetical protein
VDILQSRVDKEHKARLTQLSRITQPLDWTPRGSIKGSFKVDLGATSTETRDPLTHNLMHDPIPIPTIFQSLALNEYISLVRGMLTTLH